MNKKLIKILIILWSVIAIGVAGLLVYGIVNGGDMKNMFRPFVISSDKNLKVQKEEEIDIKDLEKVNIDFSSSDIIIESTDEPNVKIVQKASGDLDDDEKFIINKSGNEVTIERSYEKIFKLFSFGWINESIEVYIPKNYNKNLFVHTSSGNIKCSLDEVVDNATLKATSGNIAIIKNLNVNEADLEVSSGNINIESLSSKKYTVDSTSGNVNVKSVAGTGDIKTSSGNIEVNYKDIDEYSQVYANSGNVRIEIPKELSFEFNGECTSGDIKSNFDLNYKDKKGNKATAQIGNAPYKKLDVKTSSGNINIRK
ncbi:DUF4097 domain-containing protein [Clostridium sp. SHJSY1]|uniref:DUF4097 family beta strand repeat-containing protein n=1 Tax=Clostridium sp. SHJSY1 TaxID=2942483 RepID=UPI0028742D79|nr:DUF4097 family beta strand repeat-containing protein [Clostridium sp. SHJSY1]MDS0528426.1 DUF4097 domain-containing protein [Clostridium sp. SHJSY1]